MSDTTRGATSWDDTLLLLQRDSRDSGMLLLELARVESERSTPRSNAVWCMGHGRKSHLRERFTWQYWTRRGRAPARVSSAR